MIEVVERPGTLVEHVIVALRSEITAGRFAPSARLPAEQELATQLGVSRPVVREAISQLRADGVLVTRKGSGAYVANNPLGNVFRMPPGGIAAQDLDHLFEIRFWIETSAAECAAIRRKPADLARMRIALEQMRVHSDEFAKASAADVEFHRAIARATQNPYLISFTDFVGGQLLQTRAVAWSNSARLAGGAMPAQTEHEAVYRAVDAGDAELARREATIHLLAAGRRMGLDVRNLERAIANPFKAGTEPKAKVQTRRTR